MSEDDHKPADSDDRIISALQNLAPEEQLMFVKALDRHAAGECEAEEALADFVREVMQSRGAHLQ